VGVEWCIVGDHRQERHKRQSVEGLLRWRPYCVTIRHRIQNFCIRCSEEKKYEFLHNGCLENFLCRNVLPLLAEPSVADHFQYSCFVGLLASVTDGSWHAL